MDSQQNSGEGAAPVRGSQFVDYSANKVPSSPPPSPTPTPTPPTPSPTPLLPTNFNTKTESEIPSSQPPTGTPSFVSPVLPPLKSKRHFGKWIVVVLIILLVLVGGVYAASALMASPEKDISKAFANVEAAKKIKTKMSISLESTNKFIQGTSVYVTTDLDKTKAKPSGKFHADISVSGMRARGEAVFLDDAVYVRLIEAPAQYTRMQSFSLNHWYSMSQKNIESLADDYGASTVAESFPNSKNNLSSSYEKLLNAGVVTGLSFKGLGFDSGQAVKKYSFIIDKDALIKYISEQPEVAAKIGQGGLGNEAYLSQALGALDFTPVNISTNLLTGSLVSVDLDVSVSVPASGYVPAVSLTIHITGEYDDTPADFTITAPENATPLDEIVSNSLSSARNKGKDARIMSSIQQIRMQMEIDYKTSYNTAACTSKNIAALKEDIVAQGSALVCRVQPQKYLLAAKLISSSSSSSPSYYCLDSTGSMANNIKLPTGYSCK